MKTVTVVEAKSHLSSLLAEIEAGEEIVITRRGKPVAHLVAETQAREFDWAALHEWVGAGLIGKGLTVPADFRAAALLIDGPVALRSGDALHLAVVRRLGADLASLDRRLWRRRQTR
ncbi:type II toxin-antitoxin system prevent-host-death family antitoxin [Aromatoleum sp.]|uniref:type II toxin-antitoxin system prevent-host-death family antitoxin n=1 Tax=Aromatoleum sp. TaxID=2307007 RepID=UPI002FC9372B